MMDIDDICSRAKYRPEVYVPALKDELIRLRAQEQEMNRYRRAIEMALDSFAEDAPAIAAQTLRMALGAPY